MRKIVDYINMYYSVRIIFEDGKVERKGFLVLNVIY